MRQALFNALLMTLAIYTLMLASARPATSTTTCSTDTECAEVDGNNGDPDVETEDDGFELTCDEPHIERM